MRISPVRVELVNQQKKTHLPVKILHEPKPKIIQLLLTVSDVEFWGRDGLSDQVFWRKRNEDTLFARVLTRDGNIVWEELTFAEFFADYGHPYSWDGNVHLCRKRALSQLGIRIPSSPDDEIVHRLTYASGVAKLVGDLADVKKSKKQNDDLQKIFGDATEFNAKEKWKSLKNCQLKTNFDASQLSISLIEVGTLASEIENHTRLVLIREGRAAVCSSFTGKWVSITVRGDVPKGHRPDANTKQIPQSNSPWQAKGKPSPEYPLAIKDYVDAIGECVFPPKDMAATVPDAISAPVSGLIVVLGETGSGKSQIAYGLMHEYLRRRMASESGDKQENFYHVVTLEDPIEKPFHHADANYPAAAVGDITNKNKDDKILQFVEYTARHKVYDTTLQDGLKDCLRQKPAVVCVGEVRELDDWKAVLDFAGTGHLVVATAHAGKLSEAMSKLLTASEADSPSRRGDVARKILAMVQLTPVKLDTEYANADGKPTKPNVSLITLWRRNNGGASKLVAEGLSSLVPHFDPNFGSIGAQAMCNLLFGGASEDKQYAKDGITSDKQGFTKEVRAKAREHDLHGL